MTSKDYWEEAALQREQEIHDGAEESVKKMLRLYDDALDDINGEIKKIKYNFQMRYGLDEETAERYIAQEIRNGNNEKLTRQLLTAGSDEERAAILDFVHRDGLSKRAYGARAERFESLKNVIELRMIQLEYNLRNEGEAARRQAYTDNYYRVIDDTARELNMGVSFNLIDNEALNEVMDRPWHGKRFSQRIWDNTDRLAEEAQEIVGRYIVSGRSLDKAARELADAFEVEKFHATTLIHTEVAHARSVSDMKAYEDIGAEYYRYIATLDEVTCDVCAPLDGQRFRVADAVEGMNYPVMHPRCRCTTGLDKEWLGRAARDPITGKSVHIDGDLTYAQWRENMSEEEAAAFATAQRKYRNTAADKLQHEKYRVIYGKEIPKSFDKFQELKYNNVKEWERLKAGKQERLNQMDFKDMGQLVGKLGNKEARLWYKAHDENIPNLLDPSDTLEQQARKASAMRNENRTQTRELMKDKELRKELDKNKPNRSYEFYYNKYKFDKEAKRERSDDEINMMIIQKSTTTNKDADRKAGLKK
jgi:SPP1 gp7 family putative phage head morphogenesis protein